MGTLDCVFGSALMLVGLGMNAAAECGRHPERNVVAGRDNEGYYLTTRWTNERAKVRVRIQIQGVGDYLADQAGKTIVYLTTKTPALMGAGEWHAETPYEVLVAFGRAAGFEVVTPGPGFWVVSDPRERQRSAFTLFAIPADISQAGHVPPERTAALERALVNQLPVRDALCAVGDDCRLGVHYLWLPGEGEDVLLVVASTANSGPAVGLKAFRVRVDLVADPPQLHCDWSLEDVAGPLVPGIAEDFDGDGYRDFVFEGSLSTIEFGPTIVSGRYGTQLLSFQGRTLAVERKATGPKRVAAEATLNDAKASLTRVVYVFDNSVGRYRPIQPLNTQGLASSPNADSTSSSATLENTLGAVVGGRGNVRTFVLPPDIWRAYRPGIAHGPMPEECHLLFRFESAAFAAERQRQKEKAAKTPLDRPK
jgi:hypothetical protein